MLLTCIVGVFIGGLFFGLKYDLNGIHNRTGVLFFNIVYFSLASMSSIGVLLTEVRVCGAQVPFFFSHFHVPCFCAVCLCRLVSFVFFGFVVRSLL